MNEIKVAFVRAMLSKATFVAIHQESPNKSSKHRDK